MVWQYNDNVSSDEIYHWGIKGMKWGVRRYQNRDGTLTPSGKKRYADDAQRTTPSSSSQPTSNKPKSISDLSDDELRKIVNRKQTERQLRDLIEAEERSNVHVQQIQQLGQSMVSKVLRNSGEQALTIMTKGVMLYVGSKAVEQIFKNPDLAKAVATGSMGGQKKDNKKD